MFAMSQTNEKVVVPAWALWRDFLRWPVYAALLFSLAAFTLAYQVPRGASLSLDVGSQGDQPYLINFDAHESSSDNEHPFTYRWTHDLSYLTVPGVGRGVPLSLTMQLAGRSADAPPAVLTVTVNSQQVAVLHPAGYPPNPYEVAIPAEANNQDDLQVALESNVFSPPGDSRKLGVVVDSIALRQAGGGLVRPPTYVLAWLLLSVLLAYLSLRRCGLAWRGSFTLALLFSLGLSLLLATRRYDLTIFAAQFGVVMICVLALALVMPPLVVWMMERLRVPIGARHLQWLMLIYLLAFAVKAGGMMHPQFIDLDQVFRVHQVQELVNNPAVFWDKYQHVTTADERGTVHSDLQHSMLGQWNLVVPFPYSPIGYFVLAPLGWIWPHGFEDRLVTASDTSLAALAGTVVFALYAIARRGLRSGRAGVIAAAIASFAPVTYLHFSDGAYPYIWAGWISVVYIMAAICLADRAGRPLPFILLTILSALTLLSHTAIVFFAVAFVAAMAVLYLVLKKRIIAPPFPMMPLLLSFLAGGVLSLVYYGGYIVPLLTVSLPALAQKGASSGGVGLDPRNLGRPLLTGFWPQLEVHFATWPALVSVFGLGSLAITRRMAWTTRAAAVPKAGRPEDRARFRTTTLLFLGAWTVTFLIFSLIDLRVNLLQRHMIFALPLLALLAGYALAKIEWRDSGLQGILRWPWLTILLVSYLFIAGWDMWVGRVLHYILPPGSG
jgi:hypothetical protein